MADFSEAGNTRSPRLDEADRLVREAIKALRALPYAEYLRTEHWRDLCEAMLREFVCCQECGRTDTRQVHHRTYDYLGRERAEDVIVLCGDCHHKWHQTHKERLSTPSDDLVWAGRTRRFGQF